MEFDGWRGNHHCTSCYDAPGCFNACVVKRFYSPVRIHLSDPETGLQHIILPVHIHLLSYS